MLFCIVPGFSKSLSMAVITCGADADSILICFGFSHLAAIITNKHNFVFVVLGNCSPNGMPGFS